MSKRVQSQPFCHNLHTSHSRTAVDPNIAVLPAALIFINFVLAIAATIFAVKAVSHGLTKATMPAASVTINLPANVLSDATETHAGG